MLIEAALLTLLSGPAAVPETVDADVIVEVVDDGYLPIPGADVVVTGERGPAVAGETQQNGTVAFRLERGRNVEYRVRVRLAGFEAFDKRGVWFGTQRPHNRPARMQVQVHPRPAR